MRTSHLLSFAVPALSLTMAWNGAQAQETLAGVGAAGAMGATLGASSMSNVSPGQVTRGVGGSSSMDMEGGDPSGRGDSSMLGRGGMGGAAAPAPKVPPPLATASGNGNDILSQLLAPPRFRPIPERIRRSPRQQAAYSRRVARMSPKARKKLVLQKYKVPAVSYLAAYLPADRYKFGKVWKYVSTETDRFYYRPADMARHKFNANRVIGFRNWQEAMLAGYRPDPVTKPEPGNQLAFFAGLTRDEPLIQTVEYAYAGQISPSTLSSTYNYIRQVKAIIDKHPSAKPYARETYNSILTAYLVGDPSLIPTQIGYVPPPVAPMGIGGMDGMGGSGLSSSMGSSSSSSGMPSSSMMGSSSPSFPSSSSTTSSSFSSSSSIPSSQAQLRR